MAIYTVENGQLKRVAEQLEEYSGQQWEDTWDGDDYLKSMGFHLWDDAKDVYRHYQRSAETSFKQLPEVLHIFDVQAHDGVIDYILVSDHLPDYLAVIAMLEPMCNRNAELKREVEAERTSGRRK
ncbi:hypothetical protein SAMN05660489_04950 [Pseudomonas sp. LAMO17WK12:I10]|uniref:hypothetical protein n=1 Tax=unclassified Pseudomonas TaxID=196821 RepID=UPI000BD350CE|nr:MULTISPECIES: hypothetical protein [unclassified Pseudomonas]PXX58517.1 hypothetical protein H160_04922 [Pseudomonas sp. LAMO17WK12:I9]SNY48685.1 hypothetical protein SAMN05660489_04950 [Pseudomonas sp. LAMO17WK12:I10]